MKVEMDRLPMRKVAVTAHSELALSYMLNDRIKEGLELSREAQLLLEQTQEFRNGKYWLTFPLIHQALMLMELGNIADAEELLLKTIEWSTGWAKSNLIAIRIDDPLSIRYLVSYCSIVIFLGIPYKIFFY